MSSHAIVKKHKRTPSCHFQISLFCLGFCNGVCQFTTIHKKMQFTQFARTGEIWAGSERECHVFIEQVAREKSDCLVGFHVCDTSKLACYIEWIVPCFHWAGCERKSLDCFVVAYVCDTSKFACNIGSAVELNDCIILLVKLTGQLPSTLLNGAFNGFVSILAY